MSKKASQDIRQLRAIAHKLKPVVTIAGNGLSEGVLAELSPTRIVVDVHVIPGRELDDVRVTVLEKLDVPLASFRLLPTG